ncbi:MAG: hypothetical protein J7L96_01825, partial [Bacteroidales bacterium]|nr:hypothetical protein [Bacteroidales bacterium]
ICLQAFDFNSSQPVSQFTCSEFSVQFTDPPIIITPSCGDSISKTEPQNVIVSWTFPIGAVPGEIEYNLKIVEMYSADRDPNDAIETATLPLFLDAKTNINSYLIGPSDPEFIPGRYYAFLVQAQDVNGEILFKNDGKSEVCWFKYTDGILINTDITLDSIPVKKIDIFRKVFNNSIPNTTVSGQLLNKMASGVPVGTANNDGSQSGGQSSSGKIINQISMNPPFGTGTINASAYNIGGAEPLRNTSIQLVTRFSIKASDGFYNTRSLQDGLYGGNGLDVNGFKFYNLHGDEISSDKVLNTVGKVLDVTTTDNQGNFSFNFMTDFLTGPIYVANAGGGESAFGQRDYVGVLSLRIEVLNQKFCSPDVHILPNQVMYLMSHHRLLLLKISNYNYLLYLNMTLIAEVTKIAQFTWDMIQNPKLSRVADQFPTQL